MGKASLNPPKSLGIKRALDLLRLPGHRLVLMHAKAPEGTAYYVVPGGRLDRSDAQKILTRPDVVAGEDGLFPGHSQTWTIAR
jgi:hypothetical protein